MSSRSNMYENCARILTPDGKWSTSAPPHMLGASVLTHALLLILLVHLPVNRLTKPQPPGGMTFELQSPEMLCSVPDQQEIAEAPKVALLDIPTKATLANAIEARIDSLPRPQPEITQNRLKPTGTWKPPEISSSSPRKGPSELAHSTIDDKRKFFAPGTELGLALAASASSPLPGALLLGPTLDPVQVDSSAGYGALEVGSAIRVTELASPSPLRADKVQLQNIDAVRNSTSSETVIQTKSADSTSYPKLNLGHPCDSNLLLGQVLCACSGTLSEPLLNIDSGIKHSVRSPLFLWARQSGLERPNDTDVVAPNVEVVYPNDVPSIHDNAGISPWLSQYQSISPDSLSSRRSRVLISLKVDTVIVKALTFPIVTSITYEPDPVTKHLIPTFSSWFTSVEP